MSHGQLMLDLAISPRRAASADLTSVVAQENDVVVQRAPDENNNGEVFTRRWVVDLILDLAGYTPDRDLGGLLTVEPSCGAGAFLGPMIERLIASCEVHGRSLHDTEEALRAFDLLGANVERARSLVVSKLAASDVSLDRAKELAERWVTHSDFLLHEGHEKAADFVIGNPPYIRLENVPPERTAAYRRTCPTMRGRSDVYVGFIELGLRLLRPDGALGFIVADRWMHNQYGASLREFVATSFSVETVIEMHDVDAFEDEVSAYPAVTVIRRATQRNAVLATTRQSFCATEAAELKAWVATSRSSAIRNSFSAARLTSWFPGDELWPSGDPACLAVVADLEKRFPPLEDPATGTRVGIGVASGADSVYLTKDDSLVESDRLLPLAIAGDTTSGRLNWAGTYLVNPWQDGRLVDLSKFPRLGAYFEANASTLRSRHIARKRPATWHRTIDRIDPALQRRPKLLLPDLKATIHPVLDEGYFYPHHNLYFVVSDGWEIDVLGGLLLSDVANLFVGTYCVKMRGGCYRFQAQYMRRIRVPAIEALTMRDSRQLAKAFEQRDVEFATAISLRLYGLSELPSAALSRSA